MNNQEIKNIKESSTKSFAAMAKNLYIFGLNIYKEQEEYDFLASIMLDKNRTESYILHVKDYLAKRFDEHMEESSKNERLMYVDMDKVIFEMRCIHIKALIFSLT
ncbi:hypothetical protein [Xenorhabdus bovienii]|uniref:Uncharacterized protein n=1 Tax=Xenorhabdus bovienii TaxID=40576 RepID=A0A0B6XC05_XENBV|nr:hypothetical protein [Xenorhabdus bovienii]MCG3470695.1 hypothetical protein [Xenorhabdus bovienii]CDM89789.1 conserved protein of unknown function [Xenorhabdus bovienii]